MRQARGSLAVQALAVVVAAVLVARSDGPAAGGLVAAVGLALTAAFGAWSLRRGPHRPWPEAQDALAAGRAVVLWKPGCLFCERLLRGLRGDDRIAYVNVWQDAEANRVVRALNDGNEYTPTVLVGQQILRNPDAAAVRAALAR